MFGDSVVFCVGSSLLSAVSVVTFSVCCRILLWVSLVWYSAIGIMLWFILVWCKKYCRCVALWFVCSSDVTSFGFGKCFSMCSLNMYVLSKLLALSVGMIIVKSVVSSMNISSWSFLASVMGSRLTFIMCHCSISFGWVGCFSSCSCRTCARLWFCCISVLRSLATVLISICASFCIAGLSS